MKITHIVKYFYPVFGGMERVAEIISDALQDSKIEEHQVFYLRDKTHLPHIKLSKHAVLLKPLFYFKSQPFSFLQGTLAILKKLRRSDVVIIHSPLPNLEVSLYILSFFIKKRIICVMHADPKDTRWKSAGSLLNFFYSRFFKRCEAVVFTNEFNARQSKIPCPNKVVINNGVKIHLSEPKKFYHKEIYDVLYVGSFREYKGLYYLVDALQYDPHLRLQFVGSGELFEKVKQYAHDKYGESKAIFHGNISDEKLNEIYNNSDVFVLPSINGSEAFGLVQVEAMAKGLPVVNTDLETAVKLVSIDGLTGITVMPMDSNAIATAIRDILQEEKYNQFSINAIEQAKLFSSDNMAKRYLDLVINPAKSIEATRAIK